MKRSSSPEKLETLEKKSKSGENTGEEPTSTSHIPQGAMDSQGGGDSEGTSQKDQDNVEPELVGEEDSASNATNQAGEDNDEKSSPTINLDTPSASSTPVPQQPAQPAEEMETEEEIKAEDKQKEEQKELERWQLVPTTARQRMNYLLTTSKLSDCTVVVCNKESQQEYKLHSIILSMSSPEFEDLLNVSKELVITDMEPDVFKQILEYMYLDYVNLWSVERTQALYRASVRFKLPHLCEKAVEYMMAKMSLDSIWPIFDAAIATQDMILTDECNKFFKKNINDLLKHQNFTSVDQSVIASLVEDECLGIPEADLISGVLKWTHQKCLDSDLVPNLENKRSVLQSGTVGKLRFLALSKEYFVTHVAYSKSKGDESILTMEESYAILMNMVQPGSFPLPEGFSSATKQRSTTEISRLIRRVFNPLGNYQSTPQSPRLDKLTVLPGPALTAPFGCKSFSLDLTVNRNITIFGIQVPTFFPGMIGSQPKLYEETYIVSIQNASKGGKPMIGSLNWSGKVTYNSFIDLLFKDSVRLEKNNMYTIMVYTNNTYYLNQKLCTVEEAHGIKFTLKDSVTLFGKPGKQDFAFISQILYSL